MISEKAIEYAKDIRATIEQEFNTVVYRMILEQINEKKTLQRFFAGDVIDYAKENDLGYLLFFAIPVVGHDAKSHIVIQKVLQNHSKTLNLNCLKNVTRHIYPFWDANTVSWNIGYTLPFIKNEDKFHEEDRRLNNEVNGSIIHHCFYTAF